MVCYRVDNKQQQHAALEHGTLFYRAGSTCFHCHHAVWTPRAIQWHGDDERAECRWLLFHPGCAIEFGIRFFRDAHEIVGGTGEVRVKENSR